MELNELTFERIWMFRPLSANARTDGIVLGWVAVNNDGDFVGFGDTKEECISDVWSD